MNNLRVHTRKYEGSCIVSRLGVKYSTFAIIFEIFINMSICILNARSKKVFKKV